MLDFGFYNEDCLPRMKEYPDNYFSLAIVDPPYGGGFTEGGGCQGWFKKYHQSDESSQICQVERERERRGASRIGTDLGEGSTDTSQPNRRNLGGKIRQKNYIVGCCAG